MALQVARGLFRLWLVLSVLWIGGAGVVTWRDFQRNELPSYCELPASERSETLSFNCPAEARSAAIWRTEARPLIIWYGGALALVPPAVVLVLGSALVWAFRGFR
jgi:hypothetical protein